ncbi:MAG: enoyl-CoA hydratase-related protein [Thermoleophilia bacterium]|nr:enoyl-CoA hydratase-related protein [Thermoleophilia bacterium]
MTNEFCTCEMSDGVAVVTIDNPPVNALNTGMVFELTDAFRELGERKDIRVVVLTGAGSKFFMGGAEVRELLDCRTEEEGARFSAQGQGLMDLVEGLDRPVIAAVNGFALGGGCELALAADFRVAAESARFGQPEAGLGVIPGAGGTQRLPRLVGKGQAKRMMMTGDLISAAEALRIGLVESVVPDDELQAHAISLARKIAAKGPAAIRLIKRATNEGLELPLEDALQLEMRLFGEACSSGDKDEGVNAFLEKRRPAFADT